MNEKQAITVGLVIGQAMLFVVRYSAATIVVITTLHLIGVL